jgi:magnesium transporter
VKKEIEETTTEPKIILELIQYNEKEFNEYVNLGVDELLAKQNPNQVNWINLDGLADATIISKIAEHFALHSLLVEDISTDQQPKVEEYDDYLFFSLKMLYRIKKKYHRL